MPRPVPLIERTGILRPGLRPPRIVTAFARLRGERGDERFDDIATGHWIGEARDGAA